MTTRIVMVAAGCLLWTQGQCAELWSQPTATDNWSTTPTTEAWSSAPTVGSWSQEMAAPAAAPEATPTTRQWAEPAQTRQRGGCAANAKGDGRAVFVRWYGIVVPAQVVAERKDGSLCVAYDDAGLGSEWIESGRLAPPPEANARPPLPAADGDHAAEARQQMERLRATGQELNRETSRQWQETERHYEDRRRYGP